MKDVNENVESVEQEDVPQQEEQVIIHPKIIPPKVLLEILVYGEFKKGIEPKDSETYKNALELQKQIDALRGKNKFRVRILWKIIEAEMTNQQEDELQEWLVENSSCKYYIWAPMSAESNFVKSSIDKIKKLEKALHDFKMFGLIKKK